MLPEQRKSPAGNGAISNKNRVGTTSTSLSALADTRTLTPAEARFDHAYAVLVIGKAVRRHVYFNLPSAQKAVERARARGADAELVLVRLKVLNTSGVIV